jgi:hypothetical protein
MDPPLGHWVLEVLAVASCGNGLAANRGNQFLGRVMELGYDTIIYQWIGFRENLQETIDFPIKYGAFL